MGCFRGLWCLRNDALEAVLGILPVGESKHRCLRGLLRKNCPWGAFRRYSGFQNTEVESARVSGERCMYVFQKLSEAEMADGWAMFLQYGSEPRCDETETSVDPGNWEYKA